MYIRGLLLREGKRGKGKREGEGGVKGKEEEEWKGGRGR